MIWLNSTQYKAEINEREEIAKNRGDRARVLLCVIGLTPAIVTETVYALALNTDNPWLPDEIIVLTTNTGADYAREKLIEEGVFDRLKSRIRNTHPEFDPKFESASIHYPHNRADQPLKDITTIDDNKDIANFIVSFVGDLTWDDNVELHVSMAGGRKTMGFYAGYGLSIFGRDWDRLSHVLVTPDFESHREFFFPEDKTLTIKRFVDGQDDPIRIQRNAKEATVKLADISFVRLGKLTNTRSLLAKPTYSRLCRFLEGGPDIAVNVDEQKIVFSLTKLFDFGPRPSAGVTTLQADKATFYLLHVIFAKKGWGPVFYSELCDDIEPYKALYRDLTDDKFKMPKSGCYTLQVIQNKRNRLSELLHACFKDGSLHQYYQLHQPDQKSTYLNLSPENIDFPDIDRYADLVRTYARAQGK